VDIFLLNIEIMGKTAKYIDFLSPFVIMGKVIKHLIDSLKNKGM